MALEPEVVHAALFARLAAMDGLSTKTRRMISVDQFAQTAQPALEVLAQTGSALRSLGDRSIHTMNAMVTIYVRDPNDKSQPVEPLLFAWVKAVDAALSRLPSEVSPDDNPDTTLGLPYLYRCFRKDYEIHHGIDVQQSAVSMTIEMVAPE